MLLSEKLRIIQYHNSRIKKSELLKEWKDDEILKVYFTGAFSPYITFNVSEQSLKNIKEGPLEDLQLEDWEFLQKIVENPAPYKAADYRKWLARFRSELQVFLIGMLTKKPRLGIGGDTILSIIPGLWKEFTLPLAYPVDWNKVTYPCLGQAKIDGLRCVYENGVFRTRKGHIIQGLDCIYESLEKVSITKERLDGEIYVPGKTFDEISGKIRSFENTPDAHYYIFDIGFSDAIYSKRHLGLTMAAHLWLQSQIYNISVPLSRIVHNQQEALAFYQDCRNYGFEGILLKDMNIPPFTGRKRFWQKVKPVETLDVPVIGVEEGTGKYERHIGALICDLDGTEIRVGSGLTDSQRKVWFCNPDIIIGKTIEINYMEPSSKGRVRHPRLIQVRGDK